MFDTKYFFDYYKYNKQRYRERYNKQKEQKNQPIVEKDYYLNKFIESGFVIRRKLDLPTYFDKTNKVKYELREV